MDFLSRLQKSEMRGCVKDIDRSQVIQNKYCGEMVTT